LPGDRDRGRALRQETARVISTRRCALEKSELVAILRSDKAEFQRIRDRDPRAEVDLSDADLTGCDLTGAPLAGVKLTNACLRDADCTKAVFRFADLCCADLRGSKLEGANFHQAQLEGANLEDAALGTSESPPRMCLHADSFRRVRWSREQLEMMLQILNENAIWEIQYQLVPKEASQS
jgi:uncharacterized protein YjbI with pentapeptide repeats